jgi:glycosyltransferase involved in cell wall biosynthesis
MALSISFVIPAWNEAEYVGDAVASIIAALADVDETVHCDITVVDDDSSDSTAEIAVHRGARVLTVRKRNIAAVRNAGAHVTSGEVLIFVDADTRVDLPLIAETLRALCLGATWGTAKAVPWDHCPLWACLGLAAFNWYYVHWRQCAYGFYFVVRREAFMRAGGFPEESLEGEDMALSKVLMERCGPPKVFTARVATSARKAGQFGLTYHLKMLWLALRHGDAMYTHPSIADYRDGELRIK